MRKFIIIIGIIFLGLSSLLAQNSKDQKTLYKTAQEAFNEEQFGLALPLLLKYDSIYHGDYVIKYQIGVCYLNTEFERTKAIPYIEFAMKSDRTAMPSEVYKDLAELYHLDYRIEESAKMYRSYQRLEPSEKKWVEKQLFTLETAKILLNDSLNIQIENIGPPVNTECSEISPYISADESMMYYQEKDSRSFFVAYYKNDKWYQKTKLDIPNLNNYKVVRFAGISPSGDQIFVQLGDSVNTDLYYGDNLLKTCNQLDRFNDHINSKYHESSVSISPDGSTLYFSSDRPGGFGGYDIYACRLDSNEHWGKAENLGPVVNSEADELQPFIHPSLGKLYFSSNGHKTMGGFDIFEAFFYNNQWQEVKNVGYPINTTFDEKGYSINAKGSAAYWSSSRNDQTLHYDVYKVFLKENIPLTLVKGKVLAGDPPKPIEAQIQVIDKATHTLLKYVYNPNPKTGNYLLIFPPGKDYDMVVRAEGYKPYIINIYLPNQAYFYENFQEIILSPIRVNSLGATIGEEIKVTNTFYDIYSQQKDSTISTSVDSATDKKYDQLLQLIEKLIITTDTLGLSKAAYVTEEIEATGNDPQMLEPEKDYDYLFGLIEEAIETTDSTALRVLDENSINHITYQLRYFYDIDQMNEQLPERYILNDTIFAINLLSDQLKQKQALIIENENHKIESEKLKLIKKRITECTIQFEKDKAEITPQYYERLSELAQLLNHNPNLYIRVTGFAQSKEDPNVAISRATEVRQYLADQNLDLHKTVTEANYNSASSLKSNQKVEIVIFESNKALYADGVFNMAVKLNPNYTIEKNSNPKQASNSVNSNEFGSVDAQSSFYSVQIAAGSNLLGIKDPFFRKQKAIIVYSHNGLYKYCLGRFANHEAASQYKNELRKKGFGDAFVVQFINGKRVE